MSIAIIKNGEIEILAEINLSPLALYGYKRYEPQVESLGFKIIGSSGELKYSNQYKLDYKKAGNTLNLGIISFTSDNAENILRSSFKNYEFILTKIASNINNSNQYKNNNEKPINNSPEYSPKVQDNSNNEINAIQAIHQKILENAKSFLGSKNWTKEEIRISFNNKVKILDGEPKCNLFVYEMLEMSGIHLDLPNTYGRQHKTPDYPQRPYICKQWYNEEVKNFECIGKGVEALNKCLPGDIITDGHHIGIISEKNKTISASSSQGKIAENNWGWGIPEKYSVKIFRYRP